MFRFALGLLAGLALAAVGGVAYLRVAEGCFDRCGAGTHCEGRRCTAAADNRPAAPPPTRESRRKKRRTPAGDPAAAEQTLKPGDEKMVTQGDALGRPEHVDLTEPGQDGKELSQEAIEQQFRPSESAIIRCITTALGDAPLETGRVEVGYRIERDGSVSRVRVEGPALLQRNGLTACIRRVVTALHFPASGGASVVTFPFEVK